MSATLSCSDMPWSFSWLIKPFLQCRLGDALPVDPLAVVGDLHHDLAGLMPRFDTDGPHGFLARPFPFLRRFDAVVHRIPDHMGQWVGEAFDEAPVERHVLSLDIELNLLFQRGGHVAHHAGKFREHIADGLEPCPHDGVLQLRRHLVEPAVGGGQGLRIVVGDGGHAAGYGRGRARPRGS